MSTLLRRTCGEIQGADASGTASRLASTAWLATLTAELIREYLVDGAMSALAGLAGAVADEFSVNQQARWWAEYYLEEKATEI